MAGCVFSYFADGTVVMPLFLLIAILRNVGVGMLRFESSKGVALTGGLALAEEPTFHNVFRVPVNNKSVPRNKVTLH